MSNKHTPGPWHVGMNPGPMIYGPLGEQIADLRDSAELLDKSENGYNARLIAAAPQLLAECQKQVTWLRHIMATLPMRDSVRLGFEQSIKYLNTAIALAE